MSISIFAKRAFLSTNRWNDFESKEKSYKGNGHLMRVSSIIRADQIANRFDWKLNPEKGYKDDVCVYIKPHVPSGYDFPFEGKRSYLDIVDGWGLVPVLEKHPEVGVIACSRQDELLLSNVLNKSKVVFIPQHHCNFDREKRERTGIKTVGVIGTKDAFQWIPSEIKQGLEERGIELIEYCKFFSRQDIIDFYKTIDIQLIWRPYRMRLCNPLKMVNASSFGIPTIAFDEEVFKEMDGCYFGVNNAKEFLEVLDRLIEMPDIYDTYSIACREKAEEYHIDKVGEMYKKL